MSIFVLLSITRWLEGGKVMRLWRAYVVLGSVGWWVRRCITRRLEVRVEG